MRIGWGSIVLLLIVVLAGVIRFYGLGKESFWQDEFLSLKDSSGQTMLLSSLPTNVPLASLPQLTRLDAGAPWWRLWRPADSEVQPPLYYILLRFWREAFGDGEFAVRSLSAAASLVGVVFFYLCLRTQGCGATALWGTALLAVAYPQINAAQNARDYPLWMALAMGGAYAMLLIEHRGLSIARVGGLGLCALALLLMHYFAALSVASLGIYALLRLRGRARRASVAVLMGAVVIYLLLWGRELQNQDHSGMAWLADHSEYPHLQTALRIVQLPLRSISVAGDNLLASGFFLGALISALYLACKDKRLLFWIIWMAPLLLCVVGVDLVYRCRALDISRYTFVGTASFCALVPILSERIFSKRWWMAPAVVFVLGLGTVPWAYPPPTEWRDVAELFRKGVGPGDAVVYTGGNWNRWQAFCLFMGINHYAPDLPGETVLLTDIHSAIVETLPPAGRSVWMICYEPGLSAEAIFPKGRVMQEMILPNVGRVSQVVRK